MREPATFSMKVFHITKKRYQCSAQKNVAILRRHLLVKFPVSDLCDQYDIRTTLSYLWQRDFFNYEAAAFEKSGTSGSDHDCQEQSHDTVE